MIAENMDKKGEGKCMETPYNFFGIAEILPVSRKNKNATSWWSWMCCSQREISL
jgi:hypothetical protein